MGTLLQISSEEAHRSPDPRISAVVVGGELNGLGVCRSLALGRVPVGVIGCRRLNPALWSRCATSFLVDALHGDGFVDFLREYARRIGEPPFLIITDELALLSISERREELAGLYRFRLPAHDAVLMLHDKAMFHESAIRHGWPVPAGVVVRDRADLAGIASLRPPLIVKPADKRHFHQGQAPRLIAARSHAEAVTAAAGITARAGTALAQEAIEGPDEEVYFCLFYRGRGGETLGMFTGRKLASTPPGTGSTAFCTPADGYELERVTNRILDQVGYFGFGGIEYKRDARDGRFLIIEPTVGRTDWQEEVATLAGVNIPLIAYRHEVGLPPLPPAPVDRRMVWQVSWIERIRHGSKPIPPGSVVVDGLFRRDDPLPALVHYPCNLASAAAKSLLPKFLWRYFADAGACFNRTTWSGSTKAKI